MRMCLYRFFLPAVFCLLLLGPALAMSVEDEISIGSQAAAQFEAQYGVVNDPAYAGRLQRVAQRLLPHVERKDLPWRFTVVNVPEFNAAAFPGGFVYATRGLMDGLTDDELAFVIGHEMGHVDYRHSVNQLEANQARRLGITAAVIVLSGGKVNDTAMMAAEAVSGVMSNKHSQGDENESDRYGLSLMARAGYDPVFALSTLEKLGAQSSGGTPGFLNTLMGSHPLTQERIKSGIALIPSVPFQAQAAPPVGQASQPQPNRPQMSALLPDAGSSLEYTLSLLGHGFNANLQRQAEQIATGRGNAPVGTRLLRVSGPRAAGLSTLEDQLLSRPELRGGKVSFGAAVVDQGNGTVEAVLLLK